MASPMNFIDPRAAGALITSALGADPDAGALGTKRALEEVLLRERIGRARAQRGLDEGKANEFARTTAPGFIEEQVSLNTGNPVNMVKEILRATLSGETPQYSPDGRDHTIIDDDTVKQVRESLNRARHPAYREHPERLANAAKVDAQEAVRAELLRRALKGDLPLETANRGAQFLPDARTLTPYRHQSGVMINQESGTGTLSPIGESMRGLDTEKGNTERARQEAQRAAASASHARAGAEGKRGEYYGARTDLTNRTDPNKPRTGGGNPPRDRTAMDRRLAIDSAGRSADKEGLTGDRKRAYINQRLIDLDMEPLKKQVEPLPGAKADRDFEQRFNDERKGSGMRLGKYVTGKGFEVRDKGGKLVGHQPLPREDE
jgi:hypothetical protein